MRVSVIWKDGRYDAWTDLAPQGLTDEFGFRCYRYNGNRKEIRINLDSVALIEEELDDG